MLKSLAELSETERNLLYAESEQFAKYLEEGLQTYKRIIYDEWIFRYPRNPHYTNNQLTFDEYRARLSLGLYRWGR